MRHNGEWGRLEGEPAFARPAVNVNVNSLSGTTLLQINSFLVRHRSENTAQTWLALRLRV